MNNTSIDALFSKITSRKPLLANDGKSGNWLEIVVIDGQNYVVKHHTLGEDWLMRVSGDRSFWPYILWESRFFNKLPDCIDPCIIGMALVNANKDKSARLAVLMEDVGRWLIPEGNAPVTLVQHSKFLTDMAILHTTFWNWQDIIGLQTMNQRLLMFAPQTIKSELKRANIAEPIKLANEGWKLLSAVSPDMSKIVLPIQNNPSHLIRAIDETPKTFLHGDWKMGNLGQHPDGRTILLDWAYPGSGPAAWDLVWYLALNQARLPESKEKSIEFYRKALEANGISTTKWWDRQLGLCFIAIMVLFGWEKAIGDISELQWWQQKVKESVHFL